MSQEFKLVVRDTGRCIVPRLRLATTWLQRLRGLQFRRAMAGDVGLLLAPCNSVHTCFVFFSLDIALLDAKGKVLAIHRNVRPWRAIFPLRGAHAVLEVAAGRLRVEPGDVLAIAVDAEESRLPESVSKLESMRSSDDANR
jgi:uncharacterized membrane protein (UPF0127 family)